MLWALCFGASDKWFVGRPTADFEYPQYIAESPNAFACTINHVRRFVIFNDCDGCQRILRPIAHGP